MIPGTTARRIIAAAAAVLGFALPSAHADETTSLVRVVIDAPTDVGGVVTVTSRADDRQAWTLAVSSSASAVFAPLLPGRYEVRLALTGRQTADLTIDLRPARSILLRGTISTDASGSVLELAGDSSLNQGTSFTGQELRALPSSGSLWALIDTAAPFVISDRMDNGGLTTGTSPLLGSRGASWTNATLSFGDVTIRYPMRDGTLPFYPDMGAVESVVVASGLSVPDAASGATTLLLAPRRPGRELAGAIETSFSSPRMVAVTATSVAPAIARVRSWRNANVHIGGPIHSAAGAFVAASYSRVTAEDRDVLVTGASTAATVFGHVVARLSTRNEIRVVGAVQRTEHPFSGRTQFADRGAERRDTFWQSRVTWDRNTERGWQHALSAGTERAAFDPQVDSFTGGTVDRVFDGIVPDPASSSRWSNSSAQWRLASSDLGTGALRHRLQLSASVGRIAFSEHVLSATPVAELVDGLAARVWTTQLPDVDAERTVSEFSIAGTDRVALGARFSLDLGGRIGRSSGRVRGTSQDVAWVTLAPRVSFSWLPSRAFNLRGGFSRYHQPLRTDVLAFGDPGESLRQVHRWDDADADKAFDASEIGALVAVAGRHSDVASIDPELRAPSSDEVTLTAETGLGRRSTLRLTATVRRDRNLLRVVNTGVPLSSYTLRFVPDLATDPLRAGDGLLAVYDRLPSSFGQDRYLLTNIPDEDAYYEGLDLEWDLRTTRWYSLAGVTAYRSVGPAGDRGFRATENDAGVVGELGRAPNAETFAHGRLFFDRAYVLKWSTSFQTARGFLAAFTARYQDGQPFSRLVVVPDLAQGAEAISADRPGSTRFTFTVTLDARLEKRFAVGARTLAARLDVFNLTNHANEVEENPLGGDRFRDITAVQPPRTLRVGLRWEF